MATVLLTIASVFVSALALAATALIVPGTGTPNANIVADYRQHARDWYLQDTACTTATNCPDTNLVGIDYPASFWPLTVFPSWCAPGRCEKWNVSVGTGTTHMIEALAPYLGPDSTEQVVLFGYSQGGAVVANTLTHLSGLNLPAATKSRLEVVTIGGVENPDGGLWQRIGGWWPSWLLPAVPILDLSFNPAMPVGTGIHTTAIGFEYDPVTYAPLYWGNPLAVLNALAAFDNVHGYYLSPNGNDEDATLPYGYTPETLAPQLNCNTNPGNCRYDSHGNTYVMVPATSLPLANLILSFAESTGTTSLVKPFVDLLAPVAKVLIDLGYDWSGDPGVSKPLSLLPFNPLQNWLLVGAKLVVATVQGVQAFLADLGVVSPAAPGPSVGTKDVVAQEGVAATSAAWTPPAQARLGALSPTQTVDARVTADAEAGIGSGGEPGAEEGTADTVVMPEQGPPEAEVEASPQPEPQAAAERAPGDAEAVEAADPGEPGPSDQADDPAPDVESEADTEAGATEAGATEDSAENAPRSDRDDTGRDGSDDDAAGAESSDHNRAPRTAGADSGADTPAKAGTGQADSADAA